MISCIQNKMPTRSSHISCVLIATQWRVAGKKCCLQSELIVKWLPTGGQTMMGTLWGTSRQPHHAIMNTLTKYQVDNLLFICYVDVWAAVVDIFISEGRGRRHLPLFIICGHIMPGLNIDWMPPRLAGAHWPVATLRWPQCQQPLGDRKHCDILCWYYPDIIPAI